jgi:hypothetical protein
VEGVRSFKILVFARPTQGHEWLCGRAAKSGVGSAPSSSQPEASGRGDGAHGACFRVVLSVGSRSGRAPNSAPGTRDGCSSAGERTVAERLLAVPTEAGAPRITDAARRRLHAPCPTNVGAGLGAGRPRDLPTCLQPARSPKLKVAGSSPVDPVPQHQAPTAARPGRESRRAQQPATLVTAATADPVAPLARPKTCDRARREEWGLARPAPSQAPFLAVATSGVTRREAYVYPRAIVLPPEAPAG